MSYFQPSVHFLVLPGRDMCTQKQFVIHATQLIMAWVISCVMSSSALHDSSFRWEAGSAPLGVGRGEEVRGCHTSGQYPSYQSSVVILNYAATPKQSMFNHPIRKEDGAVSLLWCHIGDIMWQFSSVQFSSVAQLCPTLCDPMNRSMPGLPVHHKLPEFTQTHVHRVCDAIQPSHPLLSPSPPAPNPSQHQGLFKWVNSSHQVAKVLELQLQHQSFQWTPRTDLL